MARIGGRNTWIAAPVGLLCLAVVAGLVWLALPMLPVTALWVGDTLRAATARETPREAQESPARRAAADGAIDCRALYPDLLWSELVWGKDALLSQTRAAPATAATAVVEALAPDVLVTCAWSRRSGGSIVTTLAAVDQEALAVADAGLRGQGFACEQAEGMLHCTRSHGRTLEEHTLRDGLWLASVSSSWQPEDYGSRLDAYVWG